MSKIEIPFDSELQEQEIYIPEGFEASIEGGKIIFRKKESEDEKIRKILVGFFKGYKEEGTCGSETFNGIPTDNILAWLEKQGKEMKAKSEVTKDCMLFLHNITKQGEQKYVDKHEPKFKIGDFIANDYCSGKVIKLTNDAYLLDTGQGMPFSCEHNIHLWSINDARDGDVLSDGTTIFIFKDLLSDGSVMSYCDYDTDSGESDAFCPLSVNLMCSKITPATKEQHDTLMKAIADAGYIFDFENKELKKIEQKPAWSEGDESICRTIINGIVDDKSMCKYEKSNRIGETQINWLKSLKDRYAWRPSEEQVEALAHFVRSVGESGYASPYDNNTKLLYSLLTDLQVLEKQGKQKELSQSKVTKKSDIDDDLDALGQAIYALESFVVEDKPNKCFAGHHVPFIKAIEKLKSLKQRLAL